MQRTVNREQRAVGFGVALAVVALMFCGAAWAQIDLGAANGAKKGHVASLTDSVEVPARTAQVVELRFRVDDGFHINSNKPKDELLIPTSLKLDSADVKVLGAEYPKGAAFKLVGGGDTLDVYQGEFRVKVRMSAPKGAWTLTGKLHYQACDNAVCLPPRDVPVKVAVTGK